MRVKLQLVMYNDKGDEETVTDVIIHNKNDQRIEHLGLTLAESKQLLSTLQRHLLQQQITTFLDTRSTCPDCGTPLKLKARGSRSFRTLFGTFGRGDLGSGITPGISLLSLSTLWPSFSVGPIGLVIALLDPRH